MTLVLQDCITLAALQMQRENGDFTGDKTVLDETRLRKCIPEKFMAKDRISNLAEMVCKIWGSLKGTTAGKAKTSYLDYLHKSENTMDVYGSHFFVVEPKKQSDLPNTVVMAINIRVRDDQTLSLSLSLPIFFFFFF